MVYNTFVVGFEEKKK